ncbi:MAG: riboflavin synthase [Turicibacter sp.]
MFTGIIEEVGMLKGIKKGAKSSQLTIQGEKVLENTKIGDSICTNGICLTVTKLTGDTFVADVMAETIRRTNLSELKVGSAVNLERALSLETRLGGHIVSGHVDGLGQITGLEKEDNATWITIDASRNLLKYIIHKGSIAIDGVSLTVAYVSDDCFKVSIIPHTGEETILLNKKLGDSVNLECDIIGKYVEKLLGLAPPLHPQSKASISEDFLRQNGFL